uniref:Uncharacterized protein n=1 Tax=Oryza punctata TaxID=4537 RepID=A0A0E0KVV2_ORYPU
MRFTPVYFATTRGFQMPRARTTDGEDDSSALPVIDPAASALHDSHGSTASAVPEIHDTTARFTTAAASPPLRFTAAAPSMSLPFKDQNVDVNPSLLQRALSVAKEGFWGYSLFFHGLVAVVASGYQNEYFKKAAAAWIGRLSPRVLDVLTFCAAVAMLAKISQELDGLATHLIKLCDKHLESQEAKTQDKILDNVFNYRNGGIQIVQDNHPRKVSYELSNAINYLQGEQKREKSIMHNVSSVHN